MNELLRDPKPLIERVYAFVATRIGAGAEAEDVTSAVFERALRYGDSYDRRRGPVIAWLIGIARRELAGRPGPPQAAEPPLAVAPDVSDAVADRLTVWAAVARLDERDQELVALRYAADLTAREIGELLGLRPNTVEVALHRALRRLENDLVGLRRLPVDARPLPAVFIDNSKPLLEGEVIAVEAG